MRKKEFYYFSFDWAWGNASRMYLFIFYLFIYLVIYLFYLFIYLLIYFIYLFINLFWVDNSQVLVYIYTKKIAFKQIKVNYLKNTKEKQKQPLKDVPIKGVNWLNIDQNP